MRLILPFLVIPWLAAVTSLAGREPAPPAAAAVSVHPGATLPVVREHHYRMSGRIRPFLIWIGRDDIGTGRIGWRRDSGRRGYEVTIGTEPARAPRRLNRWGYVSEECGAGDGDLLAVMFGTAVASFADADRDSAGAGDGARVRGVRGRVESGVAHGEIVQVVLDAPPTVHDLDTVLHRLAYAPAVSGPASARITPAARPGLLTALADVLDDLVARARAPGLRIDGGSAPVPYAFGRHSYELKVRRAGQTTAQWRGSPVRAIDADFEIRTIETGARTRFELTSGLDGELAGVPLEVRWQPRWWLEIGLHLQE